MSQDKIEERLAGIERALSGYANTIQVQADMMKQLQNTLDRWMGLTNPLVGSVKLHYNKKTGESNYSVELPFSALIDNPLVKFGEAAVYIRDAMTKYDLTGQAPAATA